MSQDTQDEGPVKAVMNRASDAVGAAVGLAGAHTAGGRNTDMFVANAAISDRYEVEAARLAMERTRSDTLRGFARQMIEAHTASSHQLASALRMKETGEVEPPPEGLDERREGLLRHLREAGDEDFDARYLDQQIAAHQEAAALLKTYGASDGVPQLRSWAVAGLPAVERHLEMARSLKSAQR